MPQVIPALVYYAATFFGAYGWVAAAAALVASYAVNANQKRKANKKARDAYNSSLEDRLVMTSTANGARSRIYGQCRNVDGVIFKGTHGANSQYYTLVVALAGHECESIEKVYFNDQELTLESDGAGGFWVQTSPYMRNPVVTASLTLVPDGVGGASAVAPFEPISQSTVIDPGYGVSDVVVVGNTISVTGLLDPMAEPVVFFQYVADVPKARVWKYLGTSSQDIGSDLLASRFPALINTGTDPNTGLPNDDRFAGICALVVELEFDQDAFPTGLPNITALVRGARVFDPRDDSTAWSQNPSLIARDWSRYSRGGACTAAEVPDAMVEAAANACDTETDFETPSGTQTLPLYQCDIVCRLDVPPDQHLDEIVESMAGKSGWAGGTLRWVAGAYRAPVADITEDWVTDAESIVIVPQPPRTELVNVFRPSIFSSDLTVSGTTGQTAAYTLIPLEEVRSDDYITEDGEELPAEVTLGGVQHNVHAQHICSVLMRDAHEGYTIKLPCNMRAWALELFDTVTLTLPTFGLDEAEFEVVGWAFSVEKGVILTLKKTTAAIFDPDAEFADLNASPNSTLVLPWVVEDIENFAVEDAPQDGTQQSRAMVSWDAIAGESVRQSGRVEVQYRLINTTYSEADWQSWPEAGAATSTIVPGLNSGSFYMFRARAVNTLGVRGAWCTQVLYSPSVPLISTDQLASGSVTEVLAADVASDSHTTAVSSVTDRVLATLSYANDTGGPVTLELSLTSQRRVTASGGYAGSVEGATLYIGTHTSPIYGGGSGTVGPPYSGLLDTPALTAGQSAQWSEAVVWSFDLEDGEELEMSSYCRLYPNFGSGNVTVDSYNVNHRMTVIKR
jgi:hypothetical protein